MDRPINHPSEIGKIEIYEFSSYDIVEMYSAKYGEKYYMNTPWRYIYRRIFRLSLLLFTLSLCSSIYLIFPLVPFYILAYFKVTNFANWCQTINRGIIGIVHSGDSFQSFVLQLNSITESLLWMLFFFFIFYKFG